MPNQSTGQEGTNTSPRTLKDALILAIALGALIALVVLVLDLTTTVQDAVAVLGLIVPGVVSIAAAVFGIPIAYKAGETRGKGKGEEGKETAKNEAMAKIATRTIEKIDATGNAATVQSLATFRTPGTPAPASGATSSSAERLMAVRSFLDGVRQAANGDAEASSTNS